MLVAAIITITLALVFYTIGVWTEHKSKILKPIHLLFFYLGLIMDTTGTTLMSKIADNTQKSGAVSMHGITGAIAIILMLIHAVWASIVLIRKSDNVAKVFHKFSIIVWSIWLVPYILGMVMGMGR